MFGPQKGATPAVVKQLDAALKQYARLIERDLGRDVEFVPGAGAAGGLGAVLLAFLDAKLRRGVEIVMEAVRLREQMDDCDLVITGEGRMDAQTAGWKAPMGVAKLARELDIPVAAVVGSIGADWTDTHAFEMGLNIVVPLVRGAVTEAEAMRRPRELIADAAREAMRMLR